MESKRGTFVIALKDGVAVLSVYHNMERQAWLGGRERKRVDPERLVELHGSGYGACPVEDEPPLMRLSAGGEEQVRKRAVPRDDMGGSGQSKKW